MITDKNYLEKIPKNYLDKYTTLLESNETYSLLLQVKSQLRKTIKLLAQTKVKVNDENCENKDLLGKNFVEYQEKIMSFSYFTVISLHQYNQKESIVDFLKFLCDEINKITISTNDNKNNNINLINTNKTFRHILPHEFYLNFFKMCIDEKLPKKAFPKQNLQIDTLKFLEKQSVNVSSIKKSGIYRSFAEDCLLNKDPISGYKFAVASEDYEILNMFIELHLDQTNCPIENLYFLVRMIFELLILENFKLATFILVKKGLTHSLNQNDNKTIDFSDKSKFMEFSKNNHPLINFCFCIISAINQRIPFDKFVSLVNNYSKFLENDAGSLKKYVNQISIHYYEKPILRQGGGAFNIMNMLSNFVN